MSCCWTKKGEQYITDCGRTSKIRGRGWEYCPYCGSVLSLERRKYYQEYYKAKKAVK